MPQKKEALKKIRTSMLSRGFSLAKASLKAGRLNRLEFLIQELGQLKGTAMKVGQSLSVYGEHLLPKEINDHLKKLQQDSTPLGWEPIQQVLLQELGQELLSELEIDHEPVACASIGQVHRARIIASGEALALKVQYPGVDQAFATDLKLLKFILNMTDLIPRGARFDEIYNEIRDMFQQEINYEFERRACEAFSSRLQGDPRYVVPRVFAKYCSRRVLAMEFLSGVRADSPTVTALSQKRRNQLGLNFLDLYLRELLEFHSVQTDPHLGNYLIQIDTQGETDRLILLDFGAVREVPLAFLQDYKPLMEAGIQRDSRAIERCGRKLRLLHPDDSIELVKDFLTLCLMIMEPFEGEYDWGKSELVKRVVVQARRIVKINHVRPPPRELVFLDRKMGGVFIFLSLLKCKMECRGLMLQRLGHVTDTLTDPTPYKV